MLGSTLTALSLLPPIHGTPGLQFFPSTSAAEAHLDSGDQGQVDWAVLDPLFPIAQAGWEISVSGLCELKLWLWHCWHQTGGLDTSLQSSEPRLSIQYKGEIPKEDSKMKQPHASPQVRLAAWAVLKIWRCELAPWIS